MKGTVEKLRVIGFLICFTLASSAIAIAQHAQPASRPWEISPAEALVKYEKLLRATTDPYEKYRLTMKAAPTAWAAGEAQKAKAHAISLLQQATTPRYDRYNGDEIQVGNLVLGLVALASDDLTEAKRLLLEAGMSKGSPVLGSFGPNMLLAKKLLKLGEKEVVIRYFDLCAKFWKMGQERLDKWKAVVMEGGIPNFGPNLIYQMQPWRHENW